MPLTKEKLEQENFSLAADQCHHGYGDEYGNHWCRYQDEIAALKAEIARLKSPWQPMSTFPASGIYQAARYDEENTDTPECLEMVRAPMLKDGRILNLNSGNYARPGTFTHWCELPAPPAEGEKEEGK